MKKMSKNNELHSQKLNCCNKYKSGGVIRHLIYFKRYPKFLFQTFLRQIYRFGQLAKLQVDGWFTKNSAGKKAQTNVLQGGRSMIEMLGVLAIIGVLSVGGIAGYTKAMRMYNSNQQRRQISELVLASVEVLPNLYYYKGDKDRITLAETFDALGYVPEGITLGSGWFKDKSGNLIYPYYEVKSKSYSLMINIQQKKAEEAEDYCLNIFSVGQQYADFVSSVELHDTVSENDSGVSQSGLIFRASGNKNCSKYGGENCVKDLTPVKIKQICNLCEEKDNCRVHIFL